MTDAEATLHPTPVGEVLVVVVDGSIARLHPLRSSFDDAVADAARSLDVTVSRRASRASKAAGAQLDEYFAGRRRRFDLPLDWSGMHGFTRAALAAICDIPFGETAGYGEVAAMAGSPGAARAVGTACRVTPFSIVVPVHRVVRADGSIGEYGGHPEIKFQLLALEEAAIEQAGRVSAG